MTRIKKYYQVFVSSTYVDLREQRQAVMQTLLKMNCLPIGMELFPNGNPDVWLLIEELIDQCDLYIVITAERYGTISSTGKSYTEREYDYAVAKKKKILAYSYNGNDNLVPQGKDEDRNHKNLLKLFQEKIHKGSVNPWSHTADLKANIAIDLANVLPNLDGGWTRQQYGAYDFLAEEMQALENKFDSDNVKDLISLLHATINQFTFSNSKNRILKLGEIIPWLSEREWKILSDFARAQLRVRSNGETSNIPGKPLNNAMQSSIVDVVNHYEDQLRNFEQGILEVEGDLIERISGYFVSAVQENFLALSSDDFNFWKDEESKEYYRHNLELIKKGVQVKRIFIIPSHKMKYPDVQNVIRTQIRDNIQVSIISFDDVVPLVKSVWDRDFAIHDRFAVSFFRNYYGRIYKVDSRISEIKRYIELHNKIEANSQEVPNKGGDKKRIFENESEFTNWIKINGYKEG